MQIELLYFDGCPSWQAALEHLRTALTDLGLEADTRLTRVETDEQVIENRFVGSPTIRLDGEDLFPTGHDDYALGCRVYATPDGLRGWPTPDMLRTALNAARRGVQPTK